MAWGVSCVDTTLNKSFYKLGKFIGKNPGYFVIIPVLLTLLCITGWVFDWILISLFPINKAFRTHNAVQNERQSTNKVFSLDRYQQIKYEIDPEYLFSPVKGDGKMERAIVEEHFKVNYTSRFNVGRITRPGKYGNAIFMRIVVIHCMIVNCDHKLIFLFTYTVTVYDSMQMFFSFFFKRTIWLLLIMYERFVITRKHIYYLLDVSSIDLVESASLVLILKFQMFAQQVKAVFLHPVETVRFPILLKHTRCTERGWEIIDSHI